MATKSTGWYCRHTASIVSSTNTTATIKVECFWQNDGWHYQISNVSAWVYCNGTAYKVKDAGSINTTSNTESVSCGSYEFTINKSTSAQSIQCYAKITSNSSYVSGTKSSTSSNVSVPAKPSYTVSYNANGGSGAPSAQTKWYGTDLTLSSTKPTRTGYSFQGWGTSSSDTSVDYAAGATYSANAAITLYAIWKANTYTVSYDANGGSGAPSSQTKTYDVALTLSSTIPTKTNYTFKGWGTSASATTVAYAAGASYTANASVTLYAIWELSYVKPRITSVSVTRCASDGTVSEEGTYGKATFNWATDLAVSSITIEWKVSSTSTWSSATVTASGTSGSVAEVFGSGEISTDSTYDVRITVADSNGSTSTSKTISSIAYPIDVKSGGTGIAFGKAAEIDGYMDVAYRAQFRQPIYCFNNKGIFCKDTDGNACQVLNITGSNFTSIGAGAPGDTLIYSGISGSVNILRTGRTSQGILDLGRSYDKYSCSIRSYWGDDAVHDIVSRGEDGVTASFGYAGSSTCSTITDLKGQTIKCNGSTTWSSDENLKYDLSEFDERYDKFFDYLEPLTYKYILGASGRNHSGYIAQKVEEALEKAGLTTKEFAGVAIIPISSRETEIDGENNVVDIPGSEINYLLDKGIEEQHNLAYTEFVALNTWQIQKLKQRVSRSEEEIISLKEQVQALQELVSNLTKNQS